MLEIIAVIFLCTRMGKMMRNKGRKPLLFQIMLVVMWLAGEFLAGVVYAAVIIIQTGQEPEMRFELYLLALAGAAIGAGITFLIASLVPPAKRAPTSYNASAKYSGQQFNFEQPSDPNNPYQPPRS